MSLFLHNALLVDPEAGETRPGNLLLQGGVIAARDLRGAPGGAEHRDCGGLHLAPGIVDVGVKVCEPGERHKESFRSAGLAAASGGVTTMVTRPDTEPAIDSPEGLEYVIRRAAEAACVRVAPMAALTRGREGRQMSELAFLHAAGAAAFSDGDAVIDDARIFARCLTYAARLGAIVVAHPQEPRLSQGAAATSGKVAGLMGLPSVPAMAERMGLERDLALVEMTGARYHADQITCAAALPALARAKTAGRDVTAGTSIHHVTLNENDLAGYPTFFKVKPPLRCEADRRAVAEALGTGLIDMISSMHTPQDEESKRLPFEAAAAGAVGLETLLPATLRLVTAGDLDMAGLFRVLSLAPARRFGLPGGRLAEGAAADLVLFDPERPFVFDRFRLRSKSRNTPFDRARLQGRVAATWVAGRQVFGTEVPA